jgi:asparagine synthase (glutamine-hydrolysing)
MFQFTGVNEKHLLRKVAARHLPAGIAGRKKRGFSIPVPEVLQSNMNKVRDYLLSGQSLARSLYRPRKLESMLAFRNTGYAPLEKHKEFMVWKLFLLEIWKQHYLGARREPPTRPAPSVPEPARQMAEHCRMATPSVRPSEGGM